MTAETTRAWPDKDPDAVWPYGMNLQGNLPEGEALVAVEWSATPSGLTFSDAEIDDTGFIASTTISGGAEGTNYRVTCRFTTTSGYSDDRSLPLFVISR
jgi:hypothetical protein